jgi:predicted outer membrane protein
MKTAAAFDISLVCILCAICGSSLHAQLTDAQKAEREVKLLRKYDANRNGKLDPVERRQITADIEAAKAAKAPVANTTLPKFSARVATGTNGAPFDLKCALIENPLGYDRRPQLSWKLDDMRQGARQTAYRMLAATSVDALTPGKADVRDSGKVVSDRSHLVAWKGTAPVSGQRIHWKVKVWDQDGVDSPWSKPAWIEMGLLKPEDWSGN